MYYPYPPNSLQTRPYFPLQTNPQTLRPSPLTLTFPQGNGFLPTRAGQFIASSPISATTIAGNQNLESAGLLTNCKNLLLPGIALSVAGVSGVIAYLGFRQKAQNASQPVGPEETKSETALTKGFETNNSPIATTLPLFNTDCNKGIKLNKPEVISKQEDIIVNKVQDETYTKKHSDSFLTWPRMVGLSAISGGLFTYLKHKANVSPVPLIPQEQTKKIVSTIVPLVLPNIEESQPVKTLLPETISTVLPNVTPLIEVVKDIAASAITPEISSTVKPYSSSLSTFETITQASETALAKLKGAKALDTLSVIPTSSLLPNISKSGFLKSGLGYPTAGLVVGAGLTTLTSLMIYNKLKRRFAKTNIKAWRSSTGDKAHQKYIQDFPAKYAALRSSIRELKQYQREFKSPNKLLELTVLKCQFDFNVETIKFRIEEAKKAKEKYPAQKTEFTELLNLYKKRLALNQFKLQLYSSIYSYLSDKEKQQKILEELLKESTNLDIAIKLFRQVGLNNGRLFSDVSSNPIGYIEQNKGDIKVKCRKWALKVHPDKNDNEAMNEDVFKMFNFYNGYIVPYLAVLKIEDHLTEQLKDAGYSQARISDLLGHSRSEYLAREKALVLRVP